jgi:hypothetical protein
MITETAKQKSFLLLLSERFNELVDGQSFKRKCQ